MRKLIINIQAVMAIALAVVFTSCTEDIIHKQIILSEASFSVPATGETEKVITVNVAGSWSAETETEWLTISCEGNKITITAEANTENEERTGVISVLSADHFELLYVYQMGDNGEWIAGSADYIFSLGKVSPNGSFLAGHVANLTGAGYDIVTINTKTGEKKVLTTIPSTETIYEARCVDNTGNVFISDNFGMSGKIVNNTGVVTDIPLPAGYTGACINGMSADGSVWVGAGSVDGGGVTALKWVDGEAVVLDIPAPFSANGLTHQITMWDALGCSDDGKIIFGRAWDDQTALYWDENNDAHYVAEELMSYEYFYEEYPEYGGEIVGPCYYYNEEKMSRNGEYISFGLDNSNSTAGGIFNTSTGEITLIPNVIGWTVLNDGTLIGSSMGFSYDNTIINPDGTEITTEDFVMEKTGMIPVKNGKIMRVIEDAEGNVTGIFYVTGDNQSYIYKYVIKK